MTAPASAPAIDGDRLRGIELTDGHTVPRAAAFLFPRMVPRDEPLTDRGCAKDETGCRHRPHRHRRRLGRR
ncbi:hypothetical protein ACFLIM_29705 [Nonomuraea sp. M3C6]|uniref:Uncharacterized protein n=1 Tax=Nonomuraea marmarensis TaxID=3351344 RepID=A0ABW7AK15_9ACTN